MRTRAGLLVFFLLALFLVACGEGGKTPPAPADSSPAAVLTPRPGSAATGGVVSGERAKQHVEALAGQIGSRPAGTPAEEKAADYIAGQLASYGYQVEKQAFSFQGALAALEVVSPQATSVGAIAMRNSGSGDVRGALVDVDLAQPQAFPPGGLQGRIALATRGTVTFEEKAANASAAGAAALVVSNNQGGLFVGDLRNRAPFPVVGISQEDGQSLLQKMRQGPVTARLQVEAGSRPSHNVLARPRGQPCRVLVGGHYDSVPWGPGANDNASGTAVVLEIARAAAPKSQELGACFAAFGAEEEGLFGSRYMAANLSPEDRPTLKAMVNLDMVGVGDEWRVIGSPELIEVALGEAKELGIAASPFQLSANLGSDHQSFIQVGIPAVFIHRLDDPRYHTPEDRPSFVDPQALEGAGRLGERLLERLAAP